MTEAQAEAALAEEAEEDSEEREEASDQEKCTKLYALTARTIVKCHSSQHKESQFIAKIAIQNIRSFNFLF